MYSVSKIRPDQSFLSLCHRRRVAELSMLYKDHSNLNHCLFSKLLSAQHPELRQQLIHLGLKYHGIERPNLQVITYRLRVECGMTFPTLR